MQSREPGGTPVGEEIRAILKDPKYLGTFPPLTELFGFLAARAAFVENIVRPALAEGKIVITDRYSLSTMAYQIAGRGLPEAECMAAIKFAEGGISPFYVVLLVNQRRGLARKRRQGDAGDRFAQEDTEFHHRVWEGYWRYGEQFRALMINTDKVDSGTVFTTVRTALDQKFPKELRASGA